MASEETRIKRTVALELGVLAASALTFLLVFPDRPIVVDMGLALFALTLLFRTTPYTNRVIWARVPPALDGRSRHKRAAWLVGSGTAVLVLGSFATALALGHREGGWEGAMQRIANWHLLVALPLYLPWALVQQTLFQFYLLGRLLTLLPPSLAVPFAGIAYALVHLPSTDVVLAAAFPGICWAYAYYRYRLLWPVALSHAVLGTTFSYWVSGRDLVEEWLAGW